MYLEGGETCSSEAGAACFESEEGVDGTVEAGDEVEGSRVG